MHIPNNTKLFAGLFITTVLALIICIEAGAIGNEVDLTFTPVPTNDLTANTGDLAIQPDGKIIIFGEFEVVNGVSKNRVARLNSDGTLDNSFAFDSSGFATITNAVVQTDGKILVSGSYNSSPKLVRLNSDGSVDGTFTSALPLCGGSYFCTGRVFAVQSDGKILAALRSTFFMQTSWFLYRLNIDGSIDSSFTYVDFTGSPGALSDLIVMPAGKLFACGTSSNGYVFLVNSDGSKDTSFESPLLTTGNGQPLVTSIARQSDGKILFTGNHTSVNGISRTGLTRLNANGTLDLTFPQTIYNGTVRVLSNDKIIVGEIRRLNADGTLDNTFNPPASLGAVNKWLIDGTERIVLFGGVVGGSGTQFKYARLNPNGDFDLAFNPSTGIAGSVKLLATQADNKVIVSGGFTQMNGVPRKNLARLEPDGTIDSTFNVGTGLDQSPYALAFQTNGDILVGGHHTTYNGMTQPRLARLKANGELDSAFTPVLNGDVRSIAVQTDSKILIGGTFMSVNLATHNLLARVNSDGTTDALFNPLLSTGIIYVIVVQGDNKILIGGTFSGISGVARSNMARLNPDGSVDTAFNAGSISEVHSIVMQPDGKYLVQTFNNVKRLNANGTVDNTFQQPNFDYHGDFGYPKSIALQADGSVVVGGEFRAVNTYFRPGIVRLNSNGQLDVAFVPNGTNEYGYVYSVVNQPGGKVVIGGTFTSVGNVLRAGIARINTVPIHRIVNFDYDGDGKADVSVYRSSNNYWYLSQSSDSQFTYQPFGAPGDIPAPADYDGDGKTDLGVFRPSTGDWWYKSSITGVFVGQHWGSNGDIPRPSDFNGDGRADFIIYKPSVNYWYALSSSSGQTSTSYFGAPGDKPVIGDFDGDGKSDPAIFRPSTGTFWYMSSIDSVHRAIPWGSSTDVPAPADYDGDGKTDAAVYRPSTGFWYIFFSGTSTYSFTQFGIAEDKPIPADYDGDGKADIAVYRPSTGTWYLLRSTAGFSAQQFGNSTDLPTPNAFIP